MVNKFETHADAIKQHIKDRKEIDGIEITSFHVDYNKDATPDELYHELRKASDRLIEWGNIDIVTRLNAKISRYEKAFDEIIGLLNSGISEFSSISTRELNLRKEIYEIVDMIDSEDIDYDIEYANRSKP